jgi:hypothetical protein
MEGTQMKPETRRRQRAPSAQDIAGTLKAVADAGLAVCEVRREPGGIVRVIIGQPTHEENSGSALAEWKRNREARKSVSRSV